VVAVLGGVALVILTGVAYSVYRAPHTSPLRALAVCMTEIGVITRRARVSRGRAMAAAQDLGIDRELTRKPSRSNAGAARKPQAAQPHFRFAAGA
jgi:hypothetical protein